ncbi:HEPN domain-containing protein [Achromobacter seleniivolatilans]|uniref:HEPN domain-containing protein n=1 Tax=Achromobacter seleniivolatilans TaxID=3047478 RepID=A0ABY9M4P7_9BURK|nr:HEPN domain-containing protein [Achromobacter sp. R39]WMD21559.1 HEPN domain-containing protein [Achromobacter sp. R39]
MASSHFIKLTTSIQTLKNIYLDDALASPVPNDVHSELARAFVTFAHAEFEYYVEEALRELTHAAFNGAISGNFGSASIAMLAFSGMSSLKAGDKLGAGGKKPARKLSTRFGDAKLAILKGLDANMGVREKHIAAMAIPLGLDAASVDNTWLNDLDAFCSYRGAYVHMSRTQQRADPAAVNPNDMWLKCKRLVWTDPTLGSPGSINSFESFDAWVQSEKTGLAPLVGAPRWRLRIMTYLLQLLSRRKQNAAGEDDD